MGKLTTFQLFILGAFVVFTLGGVAAFALFRGVGEETLPPLTMWGTFDTEVMSGVLSSDLTKEYGLSIRYEEKNIDTIESELVEALASGNSPDLVLLPHELLLQQKNKIFPIPYATYPQRQFLDTYVESAEVFLAPEGILAMPIAVDPMVMYWNRTLFSSKGLASPPKTWADFVTLAPQFNEKNKAENLTRTLVALGESVNVRNFKDIISTLLLQAGTPIVAYDGNRLKSYLDDNFNYATPPAEAILRFYTEFSNPSLPHFSWNKSFRDSRDMFLQGDLGVYFGFASELTEIRARNPNLNFDVAKIPQIKDSKTNLTFARTYAVIVPRTSRNLNAALFASQVLGSKQAFETLSRYTVLPSVRRDLLSVVQSDPYKSVFSTSAIMSKNWRDPASDETRIIFADMIEAVISGRERLNGAVSRANSELESLLSE